MSGQRRTSTPAWEELASISPSVHNRYTALADHLQNESFTRVTILGPYDSGKSSLLKRLLVEGGCTVPDWLTVSARRTTFETQSVECFGPQIQDTPGLGGGVQSHSDAAREAALVTDHLMVVLPPQLITGEMDELQSILKPYCTGEDPRALMFVIARLDEAGASPDFPDEFADRVRSKKQELARLLKSKIGLDVPEPSLFAVAADPYGMVGDLGSPSPDYYDSGRDWDGINGLIAALNCVRAQHSTLRHLAERRLWQSAITEAKRQASAKLAEDAQQLQSKCEHESSLERASGDLSDCFADGRTRLYLQLEQQIESIVSSTITDPEAVRPLLEQRLQVVLVQWWKESSQRANDILKRLESELRISERGDAPEIPLPLGLDNQLKAAWDHVIGNYGEEIASRLRTNFLPELSAILTGARSSRKSRAPWVGLALAVANVIAPPIIERSARSIEQQSREIRGRGPHLTVRESVLKACHEGAEAWFREWEDEVRLLAGWVADQLNELRSHIADLRADISSLEERRHKLDAFSAFA